MEADININYQFFAEVTENLKLQSLLQRKLVPGRRVLRPKKVSCSHQLKKQFKSNLAKELIIISFVLAKVGAIQPRIKLAISSSSRKKHLPFQFKVDPNKNLSFVISILLINARSIKKHIEDLKIVMK